MARCYNRGTYDRNPLYYGRNLGWGVNTGSTFLAVSHEGSCLRIIGLFNWQDRGGTPWRVGIYSRGQTAMAIGYD